MPTVAEAAAVAKPGLSEILPWMLGGIGVSALENKFVGENLPDELKNVNLGIGGVTGLLAANPASRIGALSSLPFKQMGLFGIGAMDRLRKQQQALTDTNLETAMINRDTAKTEGANAGSKAKIIAAFLIPSLLGSGALAYYAYNQRKKQREGGYKTVGGRGESNRKQKVKIDVPVSALPPEFYESLVNADDAPSSRIRLLESRKAASMVKRADSLEQAVRDSMFGRLMGRADAAAGQALDSGPVKLMKGLGGLAWDFTGIPMFTRGIKDLGSAAGYLAENAGGEAARYGVAGLGGLLGGVPALRFGAMPLSARLIGIGRLHRQLFKNKDLVGKLAYPFVGTGRLSQMLLNTRAGQGLSAAEKALLADPATRHATFNRLYNTLGGNRNLLDQMRDLKWKYNYTPFRSSHVPGSLAGEAFLASRRGLHALGEAGKATGHMGMKYPMLTGTLAGIPLSTLGSARDEAKYLDLLDQTSGIMPQAPNYGPYRLPLSSQLASMVSNVGSGGSPAVAAQTMGFPKDPFAAAMR